jgi:hypothetical protein
VKNASALAKYSLELSNASSEAQNLNSLLLSSNVFAKELSFELAMARLKQAKAAHQKLERLISEIIIQVENDGR